MNDERPTILLVEDDPIIARTLTVSLRYHGLTLFAAGSLREAGELLDTRTFHAVLLDIGLPDGSGLDLCRRLRARDPRIPILMLTARIDERTAVQCINGGADDYVRKPYGPEELAARVNRLLARTYEPRQTLSFGDVVLDPRQRTARVGDHALPLGKREFDILAELVGAGRDLVTRERLLAALGSSSEIYDRTIDSHLSHIRAKLRKTGSGVRIEAVYGVGYRLDET